MTRVKICGITEFEDARDAVLLGADAIGLNFYPKSPRYIRASRAAKIIDKVPPFVTIVGVFVNHPDPQNLEDFALSIGLHAVQLHGSETPDYCSMIQRVKVIKAFAVDSNFRVDTLKNHGSGTFLLDGCSSGTGTGFNRNLVFGANAFGSIIIAGGLTSANVSEVVTTLHPFGVDVASGVESKPGKKDYEKMRRFIEAVQRADVGMMGDS
ncbi:MAG: N-(5'-phosphoribosyl)anthranilate isomerase [Acidobacteria bacterium]|nr:MAG: N-(5'-phosphoribosyl)anthranilate isomerase [Acidobacteriota bacterium]